MDSSSHLQSFHKLIDGSETVLTLDVSSNGAGSLFELISSKNSIDFARSSVNHVCRHLISTPD